jgi:uncharacterized protein (DUF58 family)
MTGRGQALTRDILPGLAPYVRWLRTPLATLSSAAIASLLCGMFLHPQGFILAFGIAGLILIGVLWPKLSMLGLSGSISFEMSRVREGERVAVRASLRNRYPVSAWGLAIDAGCDHISSDEQRRPGMPVAPGWKSTEASWEFTPACRGEYPVSAPAVTSGFPFGLRAARRELAFGKTLLVWPRTYPVGPVPESVRGHSSDGLALRDKPGTWGDLLGVRPYRRGDSLRRIHWPQTARHGQLVVCEVQSSAVARVQIVLDTHSSSHLGSAPDGSREWAIRVAASFVDGWARQGVEVELVLDGATIRSGGDSTRTRAAALLDALSRVKPGSRKTLDELLQASECRQRDSGLRLIITTDIGLCLPIEATLRERRDRFVVLKAAAFAGGEWAAPAIPFPMVPWIVIDGPESVAHSLGRAGKETAIGF